MFNFIPNYFIKFVNFTLNYLTYLLSCVNTYLFRNIAPINYLYLVFVFIATGGWPERENVNTNRLQELLDMYKAIVVAQRQQQDKDKKKQRGKYLSYTVCYLKTYTYLFVNICLFRKGQV